MKTKDGIEVVRAHLASAPRTFIVLRELTNFLILAPPDAIASEIFTMILVVALSSQFISKFMVGSRALNVYRNMPLLLGFSC